MKQKRFLTTKKLVLLAMLLGITAILGFTPIGYIQIPPISITLLHIPTIITAILLGPIEGIIIALGMGATSFIRAMSSSGFDVLFIDPRVSFLPRLLIPVTTYYAYRLIQYLLRTDKFSRAGAFVGAIVGSLTNSVAVLGMLYLIYAQEYVAIGEANLLVKDIVLGAISMNIIIEMIAAAVISVPVLVALKKLR